MVFVRAFFSSLAVLALCVISLDQAESTDDWVQTNVTDANTALLHSALRNASAYGPGVSKFMCVLGIVSVHTQTASKVGSNSTPEIHFDFEPGTNYKFTAGASSVDVAEDAGPCPDYLTINVVTTNFFVFSPPKPNTEMVTITSIETVEDPPIDSNWDDTATSIEVNE